MKAIKVITGADLRMVHDGLREVAKNLDIDLSKLKPGEAVLFINAAKNKLKAYSWNGVVSYVRFSDSKRAVDLGALDEIAKAFNPDGSLDYNKALKRTLEKRLASKRFDELDAL